MEVIISVSTILKTKYDKQGELWPQVHIFINGEQASAGELLKDGDELSIMLVIAGG